MTLFHLPGRPARDLIRKRLAKLEADQQKNEALLAHLIDLLEVQQLGILTALDGVQRVKDRKD